MSTELAKYASVVASLMRLTIERKIAWERVPGTPLLPGDTDSYSATYRGRRFTLRRNTLALNGSGQPSLLDFALGYGRYGLSAGNEDGSDALVFPRMQVVDDLVALVTQERTRGIDELAELLK